MPTKVVVAPDKFKDSLGALDVARYLAAGIRSVATEADVVELPVADGGEGTVAAAVQAGFTPVEVVVRGPTGDDVVALFAQRAHLAVVELAEASGLGRLPGRRPAPLDAGTFGTGQLITAALDRGATTVVLGVGGSASTDGGAGMLRALGAKFLDGAAQSLPDGGGSLHRLARLELGSLDPRLAGVRIVLASDVANPLLGPGGAAAVFGPQKGADDTQVRQLESGLGRLADVLAEATGRDWRSCPGAGAAGGTGLAALGVLGAVRRPGIDVILELLGFERVVHGANLVVTGEGALDAQTAHGKAVAGVAARAVAAGVPVVAVAGRIELDDEGLERLGLSGAYSLAACAADAADSMRRTDVLLHQVGASVARDCLIA